MNKKIAKILVDLNRFNDLMRHNQKLLRNALDPLHDFRRSFSLQLTAPMIEAQRSIKQAIGQSSLPLQLSRHVEVMQDLRNILTKIDFSTLLPAKQIDAGFMQSQTFKDSLASTFRMSNLVEITELNNEARKAFQLPSLASFSPTQNELVRIISSIQTPWVEATDVLRSFVSVAGLTSLGKAIRSAAYDPLSSDALQTLLGNWRRISLPTEVLFDWQARVKFYTDHGFDSRLTVLPEPVFTDSLYSTGILRDDLFSPVFPDIELEEPEEDADEQYWDKRRMLKAYDILFSFETHIREWLDEVMTEQFGPQWVKQRVPGDVHKAWKEKRQEALTKGEREKRFLWYADFTDYIKIIMRSDNWNEVFKALFHNSKDDVEVSFKRLHPIRLCTMHVRIITKYDFLLLTVEAQRILRAIGRLSDDDSLDEWDDTDLT